MKTIVGTLSLLLLLALAPATGAPGENPPPFNSVRELFVTQDKLPAGWTLLGSRLNRDHHDGNLLITVDASAKAFGITITERDCQPLRVGAYQLNADFFLCGNRDGAGQISTILTGWLNPGGPGEIRWTHRQWGSLILVVSTSNQRVQEEVIARYLGNLLELLDGKANALLERGRKSEALGCYTFLAKNVQDLRQAHQLWGTLWQHEVKDLKKAMACYERALAAGADKAMAPEDLWHIHEGIGLCAGMSGDLDKAESALLKALDAAQRSQNKGFIAESNYNLACVHAEAGRADRLYSYLEEAFKRDAKWATEASNDPSFARYAQEKRFKKLIEKYSK